MPLVQVNVDGDVARLSSGARAAPTLRGLVGQLRAGAPIIVLIHGYKFSPFAVERDPHRHILSLAPARACWKAVSWPRGLGFGDAGATDGLVIALGWEARGSIWRAFAEAGRVGGVLAELIGQLCADRPVDVVGHSLGARVALAALPNLAGGQVGRMILMAAAEFRTAARTAFDSPAGRSAEVINVTTRENDLFDMLLETFVSPMERTICNGLGTPRDNWLDLRIDSDATRASLGGLGFPIAAPSGRVSHWSVYLRQGLWPFYTALLREREALSLGFLRQVVHAGRSRRFSRLLAPARNFPPLLPLRRAPS